MKAAGMVLALLLPGVLAAQPAKTLTIHGEAPPEPPAPPALKEETFLGISTHSVDAALAAQMELPPETGLVVVQILPDSPAAAVGLCADPFRSIQGLVLLRRAKRRAGCCAPAGQPFPGRTRHLREARDQPAARTHRMPTRPRLCRGRREKNGRRFAAPKSRYQRRRVEDPEPKPRAFAMPRSNPDAIGAALTNHRLARAMSPQGDDFSVAAADSGQQTRRCSARSHMYSAVRPFQHRHRAAARSCRLVLLGKAQQPGAHAENAIGKPRQRAGEQRLLRPARANHRARTLLDEPEQARPQLGGKAAVVHHHVGLPGEQQAERIDVGGADRRPLAVDHGHLRVQKALVILLDLDPGIEQAAGLCTGGRADQLEAGAARSVDDQGGVTADTPRRAHDGFLPDLRQVHVAEQRADGRQLGAREAAEGTDEMIARAAQFPQHIKGNGVLVKAKKPAQEARADLPTIGIDTIERLHATGFAGVAVEAGGSLILDSAEAIRLADGYGLFVYGARDE